MKQNYLVLAFYSFNAIENPNQEVKRWKRDLADLDVTGRIYLSEEGVNAQMSILASEAEAFREWLYTAPHFQGVEVKVTPHHEHVYPKMTVKYREQLAALDKKVDMAKTGKHVSPEEWKAMLEQKDPDTVVLDVRNDYEWDVGHFKGARRPDFKTFREFPDGVKKLKQELDPKKNRIMMYCTGGIRCELYSCLLKDEGFDEVYQLDGGVINYGNEVGEEHWKGKLFVFDDRLVAPLTPEGEESQEMIGKCAHCSVETDSYINCANMDCNDLFLSCVECMDTFKGCCSAECAKAPRRRESTPTEHPKPFRKLEHEKKVQLNQKA